MQVVVVLILVALAVLILAVRLRAASGLPIGRVIYSDTGAWSRNERSLVSHRYGLVGKPDYLIQERGRIIPVEVKSGAAPRDGQPREGHVLQALAYCLLVEDQLGTSSPWAIITYSDRQFEIRNTAGARAELQNALALMRRALEAGDAHRNHQETWRCAQCGVSHACDELIG